MSELVKLKDVCQLKKGKKVQILNNKTPKSIPYLLIDTLRGIESKVFTEDDKYTDAIEDDVLIVCDGANSGLVGTGLRGAVGSTIARLRIDLTEVNKDYFMYFLKLNFSDLNTDIKGAAIPHLKQDKLLNLNLFKPTLKEQDLIVAEIEKQFTKLDAVVNDLNKIKIKLGIYKKSVLENVFNGKLIPISEWDIATLSNFGEIFTGTTPSTKKEEYYGREICFFRPKDLDVGINLNKSEIMLSKKGSNKARILPPESILVTCIGATIGKTGITGVKGATNQQINSIVPNLEKYIPKLIYYFLISEKMQREIISNSSSTTLPILNKRKFMELKTKYPKNKTEQKIILETIESKFSVIDKLEETTNQALVKVELLRKSILKKAFSGELIK